MENKTNHRHKFTMEQARQIRNDFWHNGMTYTELTKKWECSRDTIWRIIKLISYRE